MARNFKRLVLLCLLVLAALGGLRAAVWALGQEVRGADLRAGPIVTLWRDGDAAFGGLSGLIVEDAGTTVIAAGDRASLFETVLTRDASGVITAIAPVTTHPVLLHDATVPVGFKMDLEGLTRLPDGDLGLSFEGYTRIERMAAPGAVPRSTHRWDRFTSLWGNRSFEALVTLPGGRMMSVVESTEQAPGYAASVIYDDDVWQPGPAIPVAAHWSVVGGDIGPDGCLYLLDRRAQVSHGFRFRLRRLWGGPGDWQEAVIFQSAPASLGNGEGLAVWAADEAETLTATVVTDNGFWLGVPTRLIELEFAPGADCALTF